MSKKYKRSKSPENFKISRSLNHFERPSSSSYDIISDNPDIGLARHSRDRSRSRSQRYRNSSPQKRSIRDEKNPTQEIENSIYFSGDKVLPNARLLGPTDLDTSLLGSSQLLGCQGDFCNYDLSYLENADYSVEDSVQGSRSLSKFRRKLLASGSSNSLLDPDTNSVGSLSNAGWNSPSKKYSQNPMHKISYRSIIQARQEMPLVKVQLERHRRGEKAPYLRAENYAAIQDAAKFPSHYYRDVPCCDKCYKVYSIIDKARSKAIAQIQKKIDHKKQKRKNKRSEGSSEESNSDSENDHNESFTLESASNFLNSNLTSFQANQLSSLGGPRAKRSSVPGANKDPIRDLEPSNSASSNDSFEQEESTAAAEDLKQALAAIEGLTKMDVAEIRTMAKPPAAVEVVIEAVMILLTGKIISFRESFKLLSGGETFLNMLKEFDLTDVSDERLALIEPYVDNPLFRPENVRPISFCASKFCAWVHGVVHAARHQKGLAHVRTNTLKAPRDSASNMTADPSQSHEANYLKPLKRDSSGNRQGAAEELSFVQKLEKIKAIKQREMSVPHISRDPYDSSGMNVNRLGSRSSKSNMSLKSIHHGDYAPRKQLQSLEDGSVQSEAIPWSKPSSRLDPGRPYPSIKSSTLSASSETYGGKSAATAASSSSSPKKYSKRESKALKAMQQKATDRLSAQSASEGNVGLFGSPKEYRCSDGITKMPYLVIGKFSLEAKNCNFVVVHDFFDTCDATAILFKPIISRHDGCQAFCFNYPGQASTVWPRASKVELERGAKEPILNNDWVAEKLDEMLRHAEADGDILLSKPFHLVGIGNGACIAAAFCQKYANDPHYVKSLRSVVSINGFLYPDPQLTSILHSAYQVFEATPHSRPDIPVTFWSRYVFSEEYLARVNPNLALNIYTAVSNPITNDGRSKITRGCLHHKDYRGALSPGFAVKSTDQTLASGGLPGSQDEKEELFVSNGTQKFLPIQVPIVILQSTEDTLVNASNVDAFLVGRNSKHLWSHMLNVPSDALRTQAFDVNANWVGKMSMSPLDYSKFSTLGKVGLKMILECLRNPRGAFTMWTRSGHAIQQEYKAAVLDLLDVLACPTDDYVGVSYFDAPDRIQNLLSMTQSSLIDEGDGSVASVRSKGAGLEDSAVLQPKKYDIVFKLEPPKAANTTGKEREKVKTQGDAQEVETKEDIQLTEQAEHQPLSSPQSPQQQGQQPQEPLDKEAYFQSTMYDVIKSIDLAKPFEKSEIEKQSEEFDLDQLLDSQAPDSSPSAKPASGSDKTPSHETSTQPVNMKGLYALQRPDLPSSQQLSQNDQVKKEEVPIDIAVPRDFPAPDNEEVLHKYLQDGVAPSYTSSDNQRSKKEWTSVVPSASSAIELEAELREKQKEYLELQAKLAKTREDEEKARIQRIEDNQEERRMAYKEEDQVMLDRLQAELSQRQRERDFAEKQRRIQMKELEKRIAQIQWQEEDMPPLPSSSLKEEDPKKSDSNLAEPVSEMPPTRFEDPIELPKVVTQKRDIVSKLDQMLEDEEEARKKGHMSLEDYEQVKQQMAERQLERDEMLRHLSAEEQETLFESCSMTIQKVVRGHLGRRKAQSVAEKIRMERKKLLMTIKIQSVMRMVLGKKRFNYIKNIYLNNIKSAYSATQIQRIFRGFADRGYFRKLKRNESAKKIQRVFRGHLGRCAFQKEKDRLQMLRKKQLSAAKIQSVWRMKVAKEEYRSLRIHVLASIEIQRCYRGYLGRKKMARRKLWESTKPGPERIKLGLEFIEESKQAFERQQEEIDALHRAQERAEARVSHIHSELKESEKELLVLERELQEIDQIERDLSELTHERNLINESIEDAAGMPRIAGKGRKDLVMGKESRNDNDPLIDRRRKAESYALEMTIQIKRAEREKKRQELEIEFASVFQEVEKKKKSLERLEQSIADMEATRERKDREFRRLQQNLMQLLKEQKQELDDLREKGIELETAAATTAAAAVATAHKAKEHEERSAAMFSQTEELMKFQFMSMSLSYFSSLNMLKSLRDMNADTTSAAVSLSAEASATAAGAAAAANLPNMKQLSLGANDFIEASIHKKKTELEESKAAEKEYKESTSRPLPEDVRTWTVSDVAKWLDSLYLGQYITSFTEGSVDGPFLMELREEDLVQVLGIKHKLHVRKILVSREKLKPLSQQEIFKKSVVEREENADAVRNEMGVPTLDMVFSQARNGRIKRVEESLNQGFPIDSEDERGNTLLLVAAQNSNKRLAEMLLIRGANINHQNSLGNTALHFALAFDPEGTLGEYLIEHGADDSIENVQGLTPYDGVA